MCNRHSFLPFCSALGLLLITGVAPGLESANADSQVQAASTITVAAEAVGHAVVLGAGVYESGTSVRLMVAPEVGWRFDRWEGDVPGGRERENPLVLEPLVDLTLRAVVVVSNNPKEGWFKGGAVLAWGENGAGQTSVPEGLNDAIAVAAGEEHSLALRADGTVVGWGRNDSGRATPPEGLSGVIAISAGATHSLALKSDGTVVGWGDNQYGQSSPPKGLSNIVAVAAGSRHSLALRADGTVTGWGFAWAGYYPGARLSLGFGYDWLVEMPRDLNEVVAVAAGANHSLALKAGGTIIAWGVEQDTDNPDLPNGGSSYLRGRYTDAAALASGGWYNAIIRTDGTAFGWGYLDPELGWDSDPASAESLIGISVGCRGLNLGLTADGRVLTPTAAGLIEPVPGLRGATTVAAGGAHGLTLLPPMVGLVKAAPKHLFAEEGQRVRLTPVFGAATSFQWYKDSSAIDVRTLPVLDIPSIGFDDAGSYQMLATSEDAALLGSPSQVLVYRREVVGQGSIAVVPDPIEAKVEFRAAAAPGWKLDRWQGDVDGPELHQIVMADVGSTTVVARAVFVPASPITVSVDVDGRGVVAGAGVYDERSTDRLWAAPEVGWRFDRWVGDLPAGQERENPLDLELWSDAVLRAV
ncbi:MAG: InlB B-repeat-containing protein, partial [Limisphaerales bacterium]